MDHKAFIAALPPARLAQLNARSDAPGLRHLALHLGLLLFFAVWIMQGWWLWPAVLLAQGICICFLFTLVHETTHRTPFRTLWLNEWVGRLAGFLVLLPLEWFRYFHLAHHHHTNIPDKDPELLAGSKPETMPAYLLHISGLPYWSALALGLWRNGTECPPGEYVPKGARPRVIREARWMLLGYLTAGLSLLLSPLLFWIWLLPCLLGQPFLRLYLLAEHGRCAFSANMFDNTRTTLTNRVVRFLAWNMPYHTEHHCLPQVPFHRLPALHANMRGHHGVLTEGYIGFTKETLSSLR